ncbi:hypothetical protein [Mesorhizobium sp. NBSH29]|nr:hypothetical protein [Mesorhizobium sp. NBSH29]
MTDQTPKRVLIVEDEVLLAMYLEDLLTDSGMKWSVKPRVSTKP